MTTSTELIILHTTKFGENSIVAHTLSKEYGRRGFLVRGTGRKASLSLLQPLSILEADVVESSRSKLWTVRALTAKHPLTGIRNSISKNAMTMFMAEVMYRTLKDGSNESGLYEWCEKNILLLDAIDHDFSNFHIRFLLEFTVALGFYPEEHDLVPFTGEHTERIRKFMAEPFAESMLIPMSGSLRNEIAEGILRYLEYHTESAINVNSLKVLHELFA
ncbi:MAG: recombination protein O N-terminal domain-containing protein [Bacteroidales bacterium]|nr:recombination protein O N-terminal domain-containing protein [Bacteroidales bacterium]